MEYIRVKWKHSNPDEPTILYSELEIFDGLRWEVRKVHVWADGRIGYADEKVHTPSTELGDQPFSDIKNQSLDEMLQTSILDTTFEPAVISKEEFEEVWKQSKNSSGEV